MKIEAYFDGLCQPLNPGGVACYAFVIKKEGKIIHQEGGLATEPFSREATNNVAEYMALVKALEWLAANGFQSCQVCIKGDSKLVISQMRGDFKIRNKTLIPLFQKAAALKKDFSDISFLWIPRQENKEADRLSEKAYNNAFLDDPSLMERLKK